MGQLEEFQSHVKADRRWALVAAYNRWGGVPAHPKDKEAFWNAVLELLTMLEDGPPTDLEWVKLRMEWEEAHQTSKFTFGGWTTGTFLPSTAPRV